MIKLISFLPLSILIVSYIISLINKKILKPKPISFYVDDWIIEQKQTQINKTDIKELEKYIEKESNKLPSGSLLEYFIDKRGNKQKENETQKEFVVRILKTDFEKNYGISFIEFVNLYKDIEKNNPEMLI